MRMLARIAAVSAVVALVPACGGPFQGFFVPFPNTVAAVNLRGSQVVPSVVSAASGTATITVDGLQKFIDYTVDATGLAAVSAIEIRLGDPGVNGPVLFTIPVAAFPLSGRFDSTMAFLPADAVTTFAEACGAISDGHAYLVIRTGALSAEEIRGHIGQAALASTILSGAQQVPPVVTTGAGSASMTLNAAQDEIKVTLSVSGLTGITGAAIFDGPPGTAGTTALFPLAGASFTSPLVTTLTSADFTSSAGVATFPDAINALLSGGLFVQVSTATPELRGHRERDDRLERDADPVLRDDDAHRGRRRPSQSQRRSGGSQRAHHLQPERHRRRGDEPAGGDRHSQPVNPKRPGEHPDVSGRDQCDSDEPELHRGRQRQLSRRRDPWPDPSVIASRLTTPEGKAILSQTGKGNAWRGGPVLLLP